MDRLGVGGELGAHLAHPVAQGDHPVELLIGEHLQRCRLVTGQVDAVLVPHHADRVGMERLGVTPGAVRPRRTRRSAPGPAPRPWANARCSRCTGTTRAPDRARVRRRTVARDEGRGGAPRRSPTAAHRCGPGRGCSRCRGDPRSCVAPRRDGHRAAWRGGTRPGSGARPTSPVSSCTMRSLRASSRQETPPQRVAGQRRNSGGPRSGSGTLAPHPGEDYIKPT